MVSYQILGLPQESLASMIQTLAFNARLPVLLGASPFYRIPNSPIAQGAIFTPRDYVRARLTAMAMDTEWCPRDAVYTLFVTTRIVNFLKGLPVTGREELHELIAQDWPAPRLRMGSILLQRLAETGVLAFWTRQGLVRNDKFQAELFWRVLRDIGQITCQNGATIAVDGFVGPHASRSTAMPCLVPLSEPVKELLCHLTTTAQTHEQHNEVVRQEFTRQATAYAANPTIYDPERVARLLRAVQPAAEHRVLEVATGPGYVAMGFAAVAREVVGVDLTAAPLALAEQRRQELGLHNVRFQQADAMHLPFAEGEFDIAVCRLGFHHFDQAPGVLQEMVRVCAPRGHGDRRRSHCQRT